MLELTRTYVGNLMVTREQNVISGWVDNIQEQLRLASVTIDVGTMLWHPWEGCELQCVVSTELILPQLYTYVKQLFDWGCIMQICNVCGKPFAAFSGHYARCGMGACDVMQNRRNRAAFGARAKENKYDQLYANTRDYMRKQINRLGKRNDVSSKVIDQAEKWYATFRKEAKAHKKMLSRSKDEVKAFADWLFAQQRTFDDLFGK